MVGSDQAEPVKAKLIDVRVKGQEALRERFERAQIDGDLAKNADADGLARFITAVFQGMTVQAINGASREELLRLADTAMLAWPK